MRKRNPSLQIIKPAVVSTLAFIIACGLSVRPAQAVPYEVTLLQVGPDVVATGNGAIDLTGLSAAGLTGFGTQINPSLGFILTGAVISNQNAYTPLGGFSGPGSFGPGSVTFANSGTGDAVGIGISFGQLYVPTTYISDTALSDTATYAGANFGTLGVTPGTYVWTWGAGPDQKFTLQIGAAGVPDSGSTVGLLFLALTALLGARRFHSLRLA
jgi:hypothetical protein